MPARHCRDVASLCAVVAAGAVVDLLFFWGHRPRRDGRAGPAVLSQWAPLGFTVNGASYPTAEHYMMAEKARLFGDGRAEQRILTAAEPSLAKRLGRGVRGFDERTWAARRFDVVVAGNRAKFSQEPDAQSFLLSTTPTVLVEASPTDSVWGIGLDASDPAASDPRHWRGLNLLGFALMEVRARIAEERAAPPEGCA